MSDSEAGRRPGAAALAAIVRGGGLGALWLGAGGRLAMRGLAVLARRPVAFGLGASLGIVLIGVILGGLGGALARSLRPWIGRSRYRGAAFGTAMFIVLVPLQPAPIGEEIAAFHGHLTVVMLGFWLLFAGYGASLVRRHGDAAPS